METGKRLIPYSLHLTEDIYIALKKAAEGRKASAMVRNAITMILEGHGEFNSGYNKGLRDAINIVGNDKIANAISFDGQKIADTINNQISCLVIK